MKGLALTILALGSLLAQGEVSSASVVEAGPGESLAAVRDRVRALPPGVKSNGVEVVLSSGDYFLPDGLAFDAADGGVSENCPIVWRAAAKGRIRLLGAKVIPAERFKVVTDPSVLARLPEEARGKVVSADISDMLPDRMPTFPNAFTDTPPVPLVLVNGRFATLAKWPNGAAWASFTNRVDQGTLKKDGLYWDGAFVYSKDRAKRWKIADGVWLNGYWTHDWNNASVKIGSYGSENGTNDIMRLSGGISYGVMGKTWGGLKSRRFRAFNLLDELDEPGEYWLDRSARRLYLALADASIVPEVMIGMSEKPLLDISKTANLRFKGLEISCSYGPLIKAEDCAAVSFVGCRLANTASEAISITGFRNRIAGCDIFNCGTRGVSISGGNRRWLVRSDSIVEDCRIHDFGIYRRTYAPGIWMDGVGITVRGNEIHSAPHTAILYGGNEMLIEDNRIHHVLLETGDAGAVYTGRDWTTQGNVLRGNFVYELGPDGVESCAMGFYFDDCDCGDAVYGNVFWKVACGILVGGGRDHPIRNNVFAECRTGIAIDNRGMTWKQWNDRTVGGASWMLEDKAKAVRYLEEPWKSRYPHLANIMNDSPREPLYNPVEGNVFIDCTNQLVQLGGKSMDAVLPKMTFRGNLVYVSSPLVRSAAPDRRIGNAFLMLTNGVDAGFLDSRHGDFRLKPNADLVRRLPAFSEKQTFSNEVQTRGGIGNVMRKIGEGRDIRIAYFGGSITAMDGWRRLSCEWLQEKFPNVRFSEVNASIGGTGSGLGVFRLRKDVLDHRPDLVFVEFATNDRSTSAQDIWRNFDGIVLQIWAANPETDIVFVYTVTESMLPDYKAGKFNASACAMERLAEHYGIPSIGFGPRVVEAFREGRLVMSLGEMATAVPKETPDRDRAIAEMLRKEGKVLFSKDGVHPTLDGHGFYLKSFQSAFDALRKIREPARAGRIAKPYFDARFAKAKMVPVEARMCRGSSWKCLGGSGEFAALRAQVGDVWEASKPGDALEFVFYGSYCSVYDVIGPAGGRVWITVDGQRRSVPVDRFDSYCSYYRLAGFPVYSGADGVHSVRIELDGKQPDRTIVLARNPKEDVSSSKYSGVRFLVGQLELVGDLVKGNGR